MKKGAMRNTDESCRGDKDGAAPHDFTLFINNF